MQLKFKVAHSYDITWYDLIWYDDHVLYMLICVHSVQMQTVFSCECYLATNRYPLVMTSVLCCGKPQCLHNGSTDSKPFSWVKLPEGKALNRALIFLGNLSIVIPKWWTVMQFISMYWKAWRKLPLWGFASYGTDIHCLSSLSHPFWSVPHELRPEMSLISISHSTILNHQLSTVMAIYQL